MPRAAINPPGLPIPPSFSRAVEVSGPGRTLYIAGVGPMDDTGAVVGVGDIVTQADVCFAKIERVLAAANATMSDLVALTIYITDMKQLSAIKPVRERYLTGPVLPATSGLEVSALAGPDWMIEIDGVAFVES